MVVYKTIKLLHLDLHLEHKSSSVPPLEWNMKGCKTSTHTYTYTYRSLFLSTMLALLSVKCLRNH